MISHTYQNIHEARQDQLAAWMVAKGLNQSQLALILGYNYNTLRRNLSQLNKPDSFIVRIYILTELESYAPYTEEAKKLFVKEFERYKKGKMPTIQAYLEEGVIPDPEKPKKDKRSLGRKAGEKGRVRIRKGKKKKRPPTREPPKAKDPPEPRMEQEEAQSSQVVESEKTQPEKATSAEPLQLEKAQQSKLEGFFDQNPKLGLYTVCRMLEVGASMMKRFRKSGGALPPQVRSRLFWLLEEAEEFQPQNQEDEEVYLQELENTEITARIREFNEKGVLPPSNWDGPPFEITSEMEQLMAPIDAEIEEGEALFLQQQLLLQQFLEENQLDYSSFSRIVGISPFPISKMLNKDDRPSPDVRCRLFYALGQHPAFRWTNRYERYDYAAFLSSPDMELIEFYLDGGVVLSAKEVIEREEALKAGKTYELIPAQPEPVTETDPEPTLEVKVEEEDPPEPELEPVPEIEVEAEEVQSEPAPEPTLEVKVEEEDPPEPELEPVPETEVEDQGKSDFASNVSVKETVLEISNLGLLAKVSEMLSKVLRGHQAYPRQSTLTAKTFRIKEKDQFLSEAEINLLRGMVRLLTGQMNRLAQVSTDRRVDLCVQLQAELLGLIKAVEIAIDEDPEDYLKHDAQVKSFEF